MTMTDVAPAPIPGERTLLIVEDDKSFLTRLARAMEQRGFAVSTAETVADGLLQVEKAPPFYAVVDMRLGDGNGLDVISALKKRRPEAHGVVLTGYGNIATAVNAVKLGAIDYLAKPADADDVISALLADWPEEKLKEAKASGSLLEASEVAQVVMFMLTRPRGMTIRDVVMMPTHFDL